MFLLCYGSTAPGTSIATRETAFVVVLFKCQSFYAVSLRGIGSKYLLVYMASSSQSSWTHKFLLTRWRQ